ncbi:MAG TPA: hypothetical protein VFZ34_20035 [Blastocatellia bacterium]|nr:hypothetical protein [Blastocatellia bacterium]
MSDPTNAQKVVIEVVGLNAATMQQLQRWQPSRLSRLLAVYTENADVAMLGRYLVQADVLRFEPQFPLTPGVAYRAEFQAALLSKKNVAPISSTFRLPPRDMTPTTVVTQIYPSSDVVPENLLKFYIHFSAPMQRGNIYEYIQLRNDAGQVVELPFLEIDEELWDTSLTRLTLFIDPGRIKRGVLPLEEIGPSLQAGKSYTLVIRRDWKDSNGAPLKTEFQKSFRVVAPDREPPDPKLWQVQVPPANSRESLVVTFPEPIDHALAMRMVQVVNAKGQRVNGQVMLEHNERRWVFLPNAAWSHGVHLLVVPTTLEDLAGNNIGKPFEVDLFTGVERHLTTTTVQLPFEVR